MKIKTELKPCPFCGSSTLSAISGKYGGSIKCIPCGAMIVDAKYCATDTERFASFVSAVGKWNKRANEDEDDLK